MMGAEVNLLPMVYLRWAQEAAALSVTAQPARGGRAVLAVWSLAAGRLDTASFALKTDCRQSIASISSTVKPN